MMIDLLIKEPLSATVLDQGSVREMLQNSAAKRTRNATALFLSRSWDMI
jgi:hypothetical protein